MSFYLGPPRQGGKKKTDSLQNNHSLSGGFLEYSFWNNMLAIQTKFSKFTNNWPDLRVPHSSRLSTLGPQYGYLPASQSQYNSHLFLLRSAIAVEKHGGPYFLDHCCYWHDKQVRERWEVRIGDDGCSSNTDRT